MIVLDASVALKWIFGEEEGGEKARLYKEGHVITELPLPDTNSFLNPDEFLNHDVKANAVGRQRPADQPELIANVRSYLRIIQHHPAAVRRFFDAPSVRYAAA